MVRVEDIRCGIWWLLLMCLAGLNACAQSAGEDAVDRPVRTTNVDVRTLQPGTLVQYTFLPVSAKAWREVTLSFQESGVVKAIFKDMGDYVEAGESLAGLDADLLEATAIEAEAGLEFQRYNWDRARLLYDDDSIAEIELRRAAYELKRAEAHFKTTSKRLENTVLQAPFAGVVASRTIERGQLVQPGNPVFRLVQLERMKAVAWVPENQIVDLGTGNPVEVYFDSYPGKVFAAQVGRIGPAADASRRVFPLEIHLDNPGGRVRPGMIGRLRAVRRTYEEVVVVPREAVQEREGRSVLFTVAGGKARLREVRLGAFEEDRLIIKEGLSFGERIVVKGGRDLIDGDQVRVMQEIAE